MPEVIPELVYVVGLFFAIVGYLTARGLLATWTHSLGYLLQWLASKLDFKVSGLGFSVPIHLGGVFRAADSWVVTALQTWCDGAEIQIGYCLHGMQKVALYTAEAIDYLSRETAHTFDWLESVRLPKWAKWAALAAVPPALLAKLIAATVARLLPHVLRTVKVVTHDVTHEVHRVTRAVVKETVAIPRVISHLPGRVGTLERDWSRINRRLHKLERIAGAAVFAGLMANALGVTARCIRSGNVGKVARGLCGAPSKLLDDLLGLLADVWILENVCVLIPPLTKAANDIGVPLVEALTAVGAGLCPGNSRPAALQGPMPTVPAVVFDGSAGV